METSERSPSKAVLDEIDREGMKNDTEEVRRLLPTIPEFPIGRVLEADKIEADVPDNSLEITKCGLGPCKPSWLQMFASKQAFVFVFCLTSVLQGMYYTYFVSTLTTIEKLFQIQSKTTGIIMSATEMGQIGGALLLTYYGGQGHRPKWIGCGMILFALCSFLCAVPHFLFGHDLLKNSPVESHNILQNSTSNPDLCVSSGHSSLDFNIPPSNNYSDILSFIKSNKTIQDECLDGGSPTHLGSKNVQITLGIFFVSLLGIGIGATAVNNLGIPYIDDNVANKESPLYFAITIGVRILGPVLGFMLGSFCISIYVDPFINPGITPDDPRWVGAWWLGLFIVAGALLVSSLAMFSFPKVLPSSRISIIKNNHHPSIKDFPSAVRRLLKNDILLFRTASSVLHILPIAGLYTFLPKYLESQFGLTAYVANIVSGIGGILVMGIGILFSGIFIRRHRPSPRFVAGWIAFAAIGYAIGMGILMFVGCPLSKFAGLQDGQDFSQEIVARPTCNLTCPCDGLSFTPVCGTNGLTFYSPCLAGCSQYNVTQIHDHGTLIKKEVYWDCECIGPGETATIGYCPLDCNNFVWYISLFSMFVLLHSTSEVGSMLLTLRCVDPKDKALALGLISFAIGLFGNVPCPIIYGAVVDSACLIWDTQCGEIGACWLYDTKTFRHFFHGMTGLIMVLAFLVDMVVWYKARKISFNDEDTLPQEDVTGTGPIGHIESTL